MSKSNKNKEENLNNQLQEIIGDMEGLLSLVGEINATKIENLDLKDLSSKVNKFEKKYKDILPEESEDNLDSKE